MSNSNTRSALVAATLTGLFTVAASLLTYYISTKEPELSYTVVGSPTVTGESGTKRIFVAVVTNTGRKEIGNVLTRIALPNGELGELTYETSPGVKIVRTDDRNAIELVADMLNQGDFLKASFLVTSPAAGSVPNVAVRAPGVKGTLKLDPSEQGERDKIASLISVLSGALTAVLMSFLLFTRSHLAVKMGLSRGSALEQAEICAFICHACQLNIEAERLRFGSHISYRGTADYLFLRARSESEDKKIKYATALRCMLMTKDIAPNSLPAIRTSLELLEGAGLSTAEYDAIRKSALSEGNNPIAWRESILSYAADRLKKPHD